MTFKKKFTNDAQNFRIEKKKKITAMNCEGINKLTNAKNFNVLASKLRPVKTFKGEKCYFPVEKIIAQPPNVTGGAIYDKDPPLTTSG